MLIDLNNKHKTVIITFVIILIAFTSYNNYMKERKTVYILSEKNQDDEQKDVEIINPTITSNKVIVHIEGEVAKPGIYTLSVDARVIDVVNSAGGLKDTADTQKINLAKKVVDEEFVYIPSVDEEDYPSPQLISNSLSIAEDRGLININNANKDELDSLPGIGPTLAERIIEYRIQSGGFKSIEEIQNVSGIGEKKYSDIKDKITI